MRTEDWKYPQEKPELYALIQEQLREMIGGVPHFCANLANASALLNLALAEINWVGFYLMKDGRLVLGPFQGKPACIEIEVGKGVCGSAAERDAVLTVPDVHAFPGHIACDAASRSEIVLPIHAHGRIIGVLDIDSPLPDRFTGQDEAGLKEIVRILEESAEITLS